MMLNENVLIEFNDDIATISLNRPEALNALNSKMIEELDSVIDQVISNNDIKVVLLTGTGKSFVAGADISEMSTLSPSEARVFSELGSSVFRKIELMEKPVIAVINGFALGGGCELAMTADIRLASQNAKLGQPEVGLGITPGFSGTVRLPRIVGMSRAKEMIYTGAVISADEAYRIGLVDHVYDAENLMDEAKKLASKISKNSSTAIQYSKTAINRGYDLSVDDAIAVEKDLFGLCFAEPQQKEGMNAFLEKRKPNFK